jgi:hypothetical protein
MLFAAITGEDTHETLTQADAATFDVAALRMAFAVADTAVRTRGCAHAASIGGRECATAGI